MKTRCFAVLAVAMMAFASLAHGQGKPSAPPAAVPGQPGEQHRQLARLAGEWKVEQSLWLKPTEPPQVDAGTATFTMVLDGRHLQQDLHVHSKTPFHGIGYTGFDNVTGQYYTSWMDINFTGLLVLHGTYDPGSATYTFNGTMMESGATGAGTPVRQVMRVLGADHFVVDYFETRHGKEAQVIRLDYTRA
ncbi:DUF1579 family protein [Dyella sedimenti]|uniref:DUF1579 family protein n=1 Tax=Dyella sedimenti TaxID=2919947 RepID=UPI001FA9763A|nr:DUF1579 family protein [Dyella sedimenti]